MNVSHPLGKLKFVCWLENIYVGTPLLRGPYRHNKSSETAAPAIRRCGCVLEFTAGSCTLPTRKRLLTQCNQSGFMAHGGDDLIHQIIGL